MAHLKKLFGPHSTGQGDFTSLYGVVCGDHIVAHIKSVDNGGPKSWVIHSPDPVLREGFPTLRAAEQWAIQNGSALHAACEKTGDYPIFNPSTVYARKTYRRRRSYD